MSCEKLAMRERIEERTGADADAGPFRRRQILTPNVSWSQALIQALVFGLMLIALS